MLTILSTILVGKRRWEGWMLAAVNSIIICIIGAKTAQMGFIPANLFCIVLYTVNVRSWRKTEIAEALVPNP
jgi:nicotinamide riboside transporter PnuC